MFSKSKKIVTILVPCYNEEPNLILLYEALCSQENGVLNNKQYDFQLLFVNDGSTDRTQEIIDRLAENDSRINYVCLSRNFGKENAMLAGFDYAKGDCVVIIDADLQHPVDLIPQLLSFWEDGYDDVYARRISREGDNFIRRKLSQTYYRLLQRTSRFDILENVGDFRLIDRKCIDVLKQLRECERNTKALFAWIGFSKKEILYKPNLRTQGTSKWNFLSLLTLAVDGITSFTTAPLRIATILGVLASFISFVYMIFVFIKAFIWGDPVAGYPSLMVVLLFFGGVQLLCLGIIGEYIARIFNESKHRPVYVVGKIKIK